MSTYVIGDLQGCAASFDALLDEVAFDESRDRVWLVGDLVNRGPDSLGSLRAVVALGEAATVVLGNHDVHLLAVATGSRRAGRDDTIADILAAPDRAALLDWVRARPVAHRETIAGVDTLMVHGGILPSWTFDDAMARAGELERALRGDGWRDVVPALFGNDPARWDDALSGPARLRAIVNVFTRMRFCAADGAIDFDTKDAPDAAGAGFRAPPPGHRPWFDWPSRRAHDSLTLFGHWSTLGLLLRGDVVGLDTGCVWGGALTAIRLEDRATFRVDCPQSRAPG